ncbi:hypothetical protein Glove_692g48 [Diversispora epigaea]|uniref:Uncharacterized protein n=1 Tax=Diversispora epigaea TaxID=1348612 RepID=A0A397G1Y9_9GLOM|nr:hypothetical protein Glove_692g48 [Diversispora epigaea]
MKMKLEPRKMKKKAFQWYLQSAERGNSVAIGTTKDEENDNINYNNNNNNDSDEDLNIFCFLFGQRMGPMLSKNWQSLGKLGSGYFLDSVEIWVTPIECLTSPYTK